MTLVVSIIIIVVKMITGNSTWFGEWNELFMTLYKFFLWNLHLRVVLF